MFDIFWYQYGAVFFWMFLMLVMFIIFFLLPTISIWDWEEAVGPAALFLTIYFLVPIAEVLDVYHVDVEIAGVIMVASMGLLIGLFYFGLWRFGVKWKKHQRSLCKKVT